VRFTGALAPAAMPDIYASSDALAFTSLTDTQGLVLAEAAAAGLPIVAADSAVAREAAGAAARLVDPHPASFGPAMDAMARAARLTGHDPGIAGSPQQHARAMKIVYAAAQSAVHLAL
jgi:glycosyltransferase involved in cell wall biosynthesis